jgi:hypothetical protein
VASEFGTSLVYRVSFSRATQRNLVSKKKKQEREREREREEKRREEKRREKKRKEKKRKEKRKKKMFLCRSKPRWALLLN